jgi:KDO2-lipid IV(A) lauroyltransferase
MLILIADYLALFIGKSLVWPLAALPEGLSAKVARVYVSIIFLLRPRFKTVALKNLEIVFPDKPLAEREEIFIKSKEVLAENIMGFARIASLSPEKAAEICDYSKVKVQLEELRKRFSDKGALITTIHFDSFEYFIQVHALNYGPVSILARGSNLPRFDAWWRGCRERFGNKIFDRAGGFKEISKRLKNNEDVVILCDQNVKRNHAVFVDFFGVPAATSKTIALTALRTGSPVMFGAPVSTGPGTFDVTLKEIPHPSEEEGSTDEKIAKCTAHMHKAFEEQILKRPEAWFWLHRRWKTRPEGEPETFY